MTAAAHPHTTLILTADDRGTPLSVQCDTCGRRWARPADDAGADTLVWWGRHHHLTP